jgi:NADH-quinone oxidoreductase subunit H
MGFALFFLGETANIFLMSTMIVLLFFGGWLVPLIGSTGILIGSIVFAIKIVLVASSFVWVRSTFPRYRYDQLMYLGWKVFLPFSLGFFVFVVSVLFIIY